MTACREFIRTVHQELNPGSDAPLIASVKSGSIAAVEVSVERDTVLTSRPLPAIDGWLFCVSLRGSMLQYPESECFGSCAPSGGIAVFDLKDSPRLQITSLHALIVVMSRQALLDVAQSLNAAPPGRPAFDARGIDRDEAISRMAHLLLPELGTNRRSHALFVEHLLQAFAVHVAMTYAQVTPGSRTPRGGLATWQLRKAQDMLRASLDEAIRLDQVAEACRLSVSHFSRAFRQSTGMAPYAWLQRQRIEAAKTLLRVDSCSLSDVAAACGFSDQSHFTRVFHKAVGASPGVWRRVVVLDTQ